MFLKEYKNGNWFFIWNDGNLKIMDKGKVLKERKKRVINILIRDEYLEKCFLNIKVNKVIFRKL